MTPNALNIGVFKALTTVQGRTLTRSAIAVENNTRTWHQRRERTANRFKRIQNIQTLKFQLLRDKAPRSQGDKNNLTSPPQL